MVYLHTLYWSRVLDGMCVALLHHVKLFGYSCNFGAVTIIIALFMLCHGLITPSPPGLCYSFLKLTSEIYVSVAEKRGLANTQGAATTTTTLDSDRLRPNI